MTNLPREIQVRDLPSLSAVNNSDVLLIEDGDTTYKVSGQTLINYIKDHTDIHQEYVEEEQKGTAGGIVPLNQNTKIAPSYLSFGNASGTVYEGSTGKALEDSFRTHLSDKANPHSVNKSQVGLANVENKSSTAIRDELTKTNVTNALGYTPEQDGAYENATAYTDLKISELIGGAPSTLDTLKELADALATNESAVTAINQAISQKANQSALDSHTGNSTIHVTQTDKNNLAAAKAHADALHARTDATKTEISTINGNLKINGSEAAVYAHPLSGTAAGTYRQVTVDTNGHVTGGNNTPLPVTQGGTGASTAAQALTNLGINASPAELNILDGVTASAAELNYLKGVTGGIQAQLNAKAASSHGIHVPSISADSNGKLLMSNGTGGEWHALSSNDISQALGYVPGTGSNVITAVKGAAETEYQTGNVNITPAKIGLDRVDNTKDNEKSVLSASRLSTARTVALSGDITGSTAFDGSGNVSINAKLSSNASCPLIIGTQTAVTGTWTGNAASVNSLYDGLQIRYWLPFDGSGPASLNLTLSGGSATGNVLCYWKGVTRLERHYPAGSVIYLTYRINATISGGTTAYTGWWCSSDYDSNTVNTAGATDSSGKLFLVGAATQSASVQTYTHNTAYIGTDGCLYSNNQRLSGELISAAEPTGQKTNDYWMKPL